MKLKNLFRSDEENSYPVGLEEEICCGQHEVCEKELLLRAATLPIEYYDDDELDVYQGKASDSYSSEEVEVFADILHTMFEDDVVGWLGSLQLRNINLPDELKDEVILILDRS
ncbi:phospholipase [Bacteroidales bacterium OttesenSCG-928-M11]|nr:phospholipase [Bacteroidales bacterium OttesenSCG-928-M11]